MILSWEGGRRNLFYSPFSVLASSHLRRSVDRRLRLQVSAKAFMRPLLEALQSFVVRTLERRRTSTTTICRSSASSGSV